MSDNTARGFLDDICANPNDDAPRLIFADWLEDRGDVDRAEFIRAQLERAKLPAWDPRYPRLWLRERMLLERHVKEWRKELPKVKGVTWGEFRRGFIATATFGNFAMLGTHAECWAAAPLEAVTVRWPRKEDDAKRVAPIPALRELTITGTLVNGLDAHRLADAPLLGTLHTFNIADTHLGTEGFRRVVASPYLENLKALRVPHNSIGNGGVSALIDANLPSLEELDLSETGSYGRYGEDPIIDANGAVVLAGWEGLAGLRSLTLSGNELQREGLIALLESRHVTGLKLLAVRGNGLRGPALEDFGRSGSALRLDVLDLGENILSAPGIGHLAKAPCLCELKTLKLDQCELNAEAARKLAKAPFITTLRSLSLDHNSVGPKGLTALLDAKPTELHTLSLISTDLCDAGVTALVESPASDSLLELNLAGNGISEQGITRLGTAQHLRNLLVLRLPHNPIAKNAATAFAKSPLAQRLALLDLPGAPPRSSARE